MRLYFLVLLPGATHGEALMKSVMFRVLWRSVKCHTTAGRVTQPASTGFSQGFLHSRLHWSLLGVICPYSVVECNRFNWFVSTGFCGDTRTIVQSSFCWFLLSFCYFIQTWFDWFLHAIGHNWLHWFLLFLLYFRSCLTSFNLDSIVICYVVTFNKELALRLVVQTACFCCFYWDTGHCSYCTRPHYIITQSISSTGFNGAYILLVPLVFVL